MTREKLSWHSSTVDRIVQMILIISNRLLHFTQHNSHDNSKNQSFQRFCFPIDLPKSENNTVGTFSDKSKKMAVDSNNREAIELLQAAIKTQKQCINTLKSKSIN